MTIVLFYEEKKKHVSLTFHKVIPRKKFECQFYLPRTLSLVVRQCGHPIRVGQRKPDLLACCVYIKISKKVLLQT